MSDIQCVDTYGAYIVSGNLMPEIVPLVIMTLSQLRCVFKITCIPSMVSCLIWYPNPPPKYL